MGGCDWCAAPVAYVCACVLSDGRLLDREPAVALNQRGRPAQSTGPAFACRTTNSRKSAASCLRAAAALTEGHQPPPEPPLPEPLLPELPPEPDDFFFAPSVLPDGVAAHQRPPETLMSLPLT